MIDHEMAIEICLTTDTSDRGGPAYACWCRRDMYAETGIRAWMDLEILKTHWQENGGWLKHLVECGYGEAVHGRE